VHDVCVLCDQLFPNLTSDHNIKSLHSTRYQQMAVHRHRGNIHELFQVMAPALG
jgi:hypothetical protein